MTKKNKRKKRNRRKQEVFKEGKHLHINVCIVHIVISVEYEISLNNALGILVPEFHENQNIGDVTMTSFIFFSKQLCTFQLSFKPHMTCVISNWGTWGEA